MKFIISNNPDVFTPDNFAVTFITDETDPQHLQLQMYINLQSLLQVKNQLSLVWVKNQIFQHLQLQIYLNFKGPLQILN